LKALPIVVLLGIAVLVVVFMIVVRRRPAHVPNSRQESAGAIARLLVKRGLHPEWQYFIFEGRNIFGRAEEKPVEIDVESQESRDEIWSSLQHACITCTRGALAIEDLDSVNGTYVNQDKIQPGEKRSLKEGDMIQVGTVQFELVLGGGPHFVQESLVVPAQPPRIEFVARLLVIRGLQPNREYFLLRGRSIIGRGDQEPVEVDLQRQELANRVWASRQHACVTCEGHELFIEDLSTANGTYVNRRRVPPGVQHRLRQGDVIQIGEVQLEVLL
jgi:pSer/pThr/pTyr-binding forkhead associated (FHA) protein